MGIAALVATYRVGCVCRSRAQGGSKWAQVGFEWPHVRSAEREWDPSGTAEYRGTNRVGCVCRSRAQRGSEWAQVGFEWQHVRSAER